MSILERLFNRKKRRTQSDDVNRFLIEMYDRICRKSQDGDQLNCLTGPEQVFLVTQQVETEVNNGGFSQYFCNSSGNLANRMVDAFTEIGAEKTAEICKRALEVFGGTVPANRRERIERLDDEAADEIFEACDEAFYRYEEDLNALNFDYIMKHKMDFPVE